MKLSVIIPAYNSLGDVLACLNSMHALASGEHDIEWLVQDDCSPGVFFPALIPPFMASVGRNKENGGFAFNCNAGAERATGDILFFVNQDVSAAYGVSDSWDKHLLAAFDDPTVGIVGARLLFPDGSIQSAGGLFDAAGTPFHRGLGYKDRNYREVNTPEVVSWTTGAALAIRKDVFNECGGFDTAYINGYWEDCDLSMKVRQRGLTVFYEPRVTLVHPVGSTGGNPRFRENALIFKRKWVDTGIVKPDVPVRKAVYW